MIVKERIDYKAVIAGLVVLLAGIILAVADVSRLHLTASWGLSVGCSLIASALVILLNAIFVEKKQYSALDEWKIEKIFSTRAEKNSESDTELDKARYCVDIVAFGLNSFREAHDKRVEACLRRGVNFRIVTMDPDSSFVTQREKEEGQVENQIKASIEHLIEWANKKNQLNCKGKVVVKGYSSMTLDFYWRVDDTVCVGPYWYGVGSQQTITYKYCAGGKGFTKYTDYFEKLWDNSSLCKPLTTQTEIQKRRK